MSKIKLNIEKGVTSFAEGHQTRYWTFTIQGINTCHYINSFSNDLRSNKKYHCFIDFGDHREGASYETDVFKYAVNWILQTIRINKKLV